MAIEPLGDSLTRSGRPSEPIAFDRECVRIGFIIQLAPSDHVLDIGCGVGGIARPLAPFSARWSGCDLSLNMVKAARSARQPNADFVRAAAARLPFKRNTFDKVLIYSSLHYLNRDKAKEAVDEAKRVCRPGGRILLGDLPDANLKRSYELATGFGWYRRMLSRGSRALRFLTRRPRLLETWFSRRWVSVTFDDGQFSVQIIDRDSKFRFDALLLRR